MTYFSKLPLIPYSVDSGRTFKVVSDILRRVSVNQQTKENYGIYEEYTIQDGETPESVSFKFYGDPQYHWVVMLLNDIIDPRYDWPLTDTQLYNFVDTKYSGNISGVKYHTVSADDDTVVDTTQPTPVLTLNVTLNFPSNIGTLFEYAANGTPTATTSMTTEEATIVSLLQQPDTTKPLVSTQSGSAFGNVLYRGDITHSFVTDPSAVLDRRSITSAESVQIQRVHNGNDIARTNGELINQHVAYYIIKPIVESGNASLLANIQIGGNIGNTSAYFDGTNHYTITNRTNWVNEYVRLTAGTVASPLGSFLIEPAQYYYLRGDITGTTFLSGEKDRLGTDANIAVLYQKGLLSSSNVHYSNVTTLLNFLKANAVVGPLIVSLGFTSTSVSYDYPYANAYPITNLAYESKLNEEKRTIRVLRPKFLSAFVSEFEALING